MFGNVDQMQAQRHQEALRREADQRRMVARVASDEPRSDRARRALRLRLSLAA